MSNPSGTGQQLRAGTARIYTHADRARLILICRGKRLGFSVREIAEFLALYDADPHQAEQMRFLGQKCREKGISAGSLDLLIASVAIHHQAELITFDEDFSAIARISTLNVTLLTRNPG
jgi:predicted nucleic acid-binding protein